MCTIFQGLRSMTCLRLLRVAGGPLGRGVQLSRGRRSRVGGAALRALQLRGSLGRLALRRLPRRLRRAGAAGVMLAARTRAARLVWPCRGLRSHARHGYLQQPLHASANVSAAATDMRVAMRGSKCTRCCQ